MATYENQHFVPVFYSRRWAGANGQVVRCVVEHGKFEPKPRGANAIGCRKNLWSLNGAADHGTRVTVEQNFFSRVIDSKAGLVAKQMIESPGKPLAEEQQIDWARFLVSLRYRNPIILEHEIGRIAAMTLDDPERPQWPLLDLPMNFTNMRALLLQARVSQVEELAHFHRDRIWSVLEIQEAPFKLLTCDWPLLRFKCPLGHHLPDSYLMPLSPDRLFLAAGSPVDLAAFQRMNSNQIVRTVNDAVTNSFLYDVWASDLAQMGYVERRMRARGPFNVERLLNQTF